jgi:HEAT repeat protein
VTPEGDGTVRRREAAATAGHTGDADAARRYLHDPAPGVRATALGALARVGEVTEKDLHDGLADPDPAVRRRACEVAAAVAGVDLRPALHDADPTVVEAAAWALGERGPESTQAIDDLVGIASSHDEALCREAAVVALGSIGDERALPAILAALADRPNVRRRAVIALAPFSGPEVDGALEQAKADRDWQVRQAAEDLSPEPPG